MTDAQRRQRAYIAVWRARDAYRVQAVGEGLIGTFFLLEFLRCAARGQWLLGIGLIAIQGGIIWGICWGSPGACGRSRIGIGL